MMNGLDDQLMMSQELFGIIPDLEEIQFQNNPIISYKIKGIDSYVSFQLKEASVGKNFYMEYFLPLQMSLEITKNYHEVVIEEIKLIYSELTSTLDGPFKICNVRLKMLDSKDQQCLLRLDLEK
jgi:hypothetical protein